MADIEIEHLLTTVPVRKPKRSEFFRVHPGKEYTVDTYLLEHETDRDKETYLVVPGVQLLASDQLRPRRLFTAINKFGTVFPWPVKLSSASNDRIRRGSDSATT
jgi:hypothetical protein